MLPPAILDAADRLITTLMTLSDAVAPIARGTPTPNLPARTAESFYLRLVELITALIRVVHTGLRTPRQPSDDLADPPDPEPGTGASFGRAPPSLDRLPRRAGWLLAALPDIAPEIAAELRMLLADPAVATLLDAAPTLHRALKPLLRSLDLTIPGPPLTPPPDLPFLGPNQSPQPRQPPDAPAPEGTPKNPTAPANLLSRQKCFVFATITLRLPRLTPRSPPSAPVATH